jgi:hypothetical protein
MTIAAKSLGISCSGSMGEDVYHIRDERNYPLTCSYAASCSVNKQAGHRPPTPTRRMNAPQLSHLCSPSALVPQQSHS